MGKYMLQRCRLSNSVQERRKHWAFCIQGSDADRNERKQERHEISYSVWFKVSFNPELWLLLMCVCLSLYVWKQQRVKKREATNPWWWKYTTNKPSGNKPISFILIFTVRNVRIIWEIQIFSFVACLLKVARSTAPRPWFSVVLFGSKCLAMKVTPSRCPLPFRGKCGLALSFVLDFFHIQQ